MFCLRNEKIDFSYASMPRDLGPELQCLLKVKQDLSIDFSGCCWLVGYVALRPKSTAMVIAGRSVNLTTRFPGQA